MYDAGLKYVSVVSYTKEICRLGAIYVPRFVSFQESSQCTLGQIFVDIGHKGTLLKLVKIFVGQDVFTDICLVTRVQSFLYHIRTI